MSPIPKPANYQVLYEVKNPKRHQKIFTACNHKFKIQFEHTNGDPIGFNYKCAVFIILEDGTWQHIVDNKALDVPWKNYYFLDNSPEYESLIVNENTKVEAEFMKYIKAVY